MKKTNAATHDKVRWMYQKTASTQARTREIYLQMHVQSVKLARSTHNWENGA